MLDADGLPFDCEGDEDFCDPLGDAPKPHADILAGWSHNTDGALVLEVRFAAPPFTGGDKQTLRILLREDADPSNDDTTDEFDAEGCTTPMWIAADRYFTLSNDTSPGGPPAPYPPSVWEGTASDPLGQRVALNLCEDIQVTSDLTTLRLWLRDGMPMTAERSYVVESGHPYLPGPPRSCDLSPFRLEAISVLEGAPDDQSFASICDAQCPAGTL